MKVISETEFKNFEPWCGARETWQEIKAAGKLECLECMLADIYPNGIDSVHLNDLLWFDVDWIFEMLEMPVEN